MESHCKLIPVPLALQFRNPVHIYSVKDLDNFILKSILDWAKDEYTCPQSLFNYIYEKITPENWKSKIQNCHQWKEHSKLICNIETNVRIMLRLRPIVTYNEVVSKMNEFYPNCRNFSGPLEKFPIIRYEILNNFRPTQDTLLLGSSDLIADCADFLKKRMTEFRLPNKTLNIDHITIESFHNYLKYKYRKSDIGELGVKITDFHSLKRIVQCHMADSYLSNIKSKRLTKLLRTELTDAMSAMTTKLKSTKIFPKECKVKGAIETFATLPFKEALQKFFQPLLDLQNDISEQYNLDKAALEKDDPMSVIKTIFAALSQDEVYGKLFHLTAIVGAVHETKNGNVKLKDNSDTKEAIVVQGTDNVFHELFSDIGEFLKLFFAHQFDWNSKNPHPSMDNLEIIMGRICAHCSFIVSRRDTTRLNFDHYKQWCFSQLSECCLSIVKSYKGTTSLEDIGSATSMHLDLLPQALFLLINLMSRCQVIQYEQKTASVSKSLAAIVFKSVWNDICGSMSADDVDMDTSLKIQEKMLEIMELEDWPFDESFCEYIASNASLQSKEAPLTEVTGHSGPCVCVAMNPQYVINKVKRLPRSVPIDDFANDVLFLQQGLLESPSTKRLIMETWTEHCQNMSDAMEDGLTPVVDVQSASMCRTVRQPMTVTDSQAVMVTISEVPLLEDVCHVTKWNELYRHYWGDVSQFVQDNVLLAMKYNVRIAETQLGRLRIAASVDEAIVSEICKNLQTADNHTFAKTSRQIIGLFVSLIVKTSFNSPIHLFVIEKTAEAVSQNRFSTFVANVFQDVSSEFVSDVFIHFLYLIATKLFNSEACSEMQKSLALCSSATVSLLRLYNADHPVLKFFVHSKAIQPTITIQKQIEKYVCQEAAGNENISTLYNNNISEEFEISNQSTLKDIPNTLIKRIRPESGETKRHIVEEIQRSEFGVGLEDTEFVTNFNRRMARLVDHFSSDLYANPTHFVIELIQNADDNRYDNNVRAHLNLSWLRTVDQLTLKVLNNECGFSDTDLRSLCDIGASTKSLDRPDKIGRKGIGFKSVFLVSDCPEVHSNGFHIRFNRYSIDEDNKKVSSNALVPEWIGDSSEPQNDDSTMILLPIVNSLCETIQDSVAKQLDPSLLLFLRRLRCISVTNGPSIETVDDECINHRKVIITEQGVKHSWFMYTRTITITDSNLRNISPGGLVRTDVSVAVPFNDDQRSHDMPAFAFLPIRSYGLRFIVNADFTIPASREDITNNCPWNKWLIDQAADLFVQSLKTFINTETVTGQNIAKFVDSVPLPGEVPSDSSFCIMVPKLRFSLSQLSWLPNHDGCLYPPTKLFIESNDDPCLTNMLCERLNMSILHSSINDVANDRRMSVLKWLGCQQLSLSHLALLLETIKDQELLDPSLVKSIIIAVHTCLQRERNSSSINSILLMLRSKKLWPVVSTDNIPCSLASCIVPVFLPPSHFSETCDRYYLLRQVISPAFIATFIAEDNKHVNPAVAILKRLGVCELTTKSMIDHAILPSLSEPKNISRQWLIQSSQFLVEHCNPQQYKESVIPKLKFATVTYTRKGIFQTVTPSCEMSKVHFPISLYSNSVVSLLQDRLSYVVIDDAYLKCSLTLNQWTNYFLGVGASRTFYATITDNNDTIYPELTELLALNDRLLNIELLRYLDQNWTLLNTTTLIPYLTSMKWIPVSTSLYDKNLLLSKTLYKPSDVVYISSNYQDKLIIADSLLVHFPYCPVMFNNDTLPQQLGMTVQVTVGHVFGFLKRVIVEQTVSINRQQALDLYNWISQNLSKDDVRGMFTQLKTLLNNDMMILMPSDNDETELLPVGRCYWSLPLDRVFPQSQVIKDNLLKIYSEHYRSSTQRPLLYIYPNFRELFVEILKVPEYPTVETLAPCLHSSLQELTHDRLQELNSAEIDLIADVYNVVDFLDHYHEQSCRSQINRMYLIPCMSGRYRSYDNCTNEFQIYSWKNKANVEAFQDIVANSVTIPFDFLSINCFTKRENVPHTDSRNQYRLTASQFIGKYFNLPVLEDHIHSDVTNRDQFQMCTDTKSMFDHLEVIVSQWIQKNVARDFVAHSLHLLASITGFYRGDNDVDVVNTLFHQTNISYRTTHKVFIDSLAGTDSYEMFIGGMDMENDGMEVFDGIVSHLAQWLLDGDAMTYTRNNFMTFFKSLLDLIESSDRDQVSIFIRSHNLRIQAFSIDYIYNMIARDQESSLACSFEEQKEESLIIDAKSESCVMKKSRKRNKITVDSDVPEKKARMKIEYDQDLNSKSPEVRKSVSRPCTPGDFSQSVSLTVTPVTNCQRLSRPGTPRLDQISLRNMESATMSGRIGEQLANDKLKSTRCLGQWELLKIDWLNEHKESWLPYDFKLRAKRENVIETIYLEVKATTQSDKKQFNLSAQEVTAAWSFKSQFHLLLVFHSGTSSENNVKYAHMPDVLGQLQDGNCKLLIDLSTVLED